MNYKLRAVTYAVTYAITYENYVINGADHGFRPKSCNFAKNRTFSIFQGWGGEGGIIGNQVRIATRAKNPKPHPDA